MKKVGLLFFTIILVGFAAIVILINASLSSSRSSLAVETQPRLDTDVSVNALDETATFIPGYPSDLTVQAIGMIGQPQWGFIENPSVPIPGRDFQPENAWKYDTGDGYVLVIAGYSLSHDDQAIVFVDIDRQSGITTRTFTVPDARGFIRIVKAVGTRLVLETKDNKTLYFDVPGLCFVDSLDEVVPTATLWKPLILPVLNETVLPAYP